MGTAFRFSTSGEGDLITLANFGNSTVGTQPSGGLTLGNDGNYYGTTKNGGPNNTGTIFKVSPTGQYTHLYTFGLSGTNFGFEPVGTLVRGSSGSFYGTTAKGGNPGLFGPSDGYGTVYKFVTDGTPSGSSLTKLVDFTSTTDPIFGGGKAGASPDAGLVYGPDGKLYGTTTQGGDGGHGTVFRVVP